MFPNDNLDDGQKKPDNSDEPSSDLSQDSTETTTQVVQEITTEEVIKPTETPVTDIPASSAPEVPIPQPTTPLVQDTPQPIQPLFSSDPAPAYPVKKSKTKLILGACLTILIIGGATAYIFLIFIPSKPENVYKNAMDRSGRGLEKVVTQVTAKSELDRFKKGEYKGVIDATFDPIKVQGSLDLKYDNSKLDLNFDIKTSEDGQKEQTYRAQVLTEIKEGTTYPDVYFIIDGIRDLGLEGIVPGIEKLDNTWVKIEESYIKDTVEQYKSLLTSGGDTDITAEPPKVTNEDIEELSKIFSALVKDYVLTKDTTKSILVNKNFLGKEKIDNMNTYHYLVGFNKDNYLKACIDSANRLFDSSAYKKLTQSKEQDIKTVKEESAKTCEDSKADIKDDETFDLWVDAKYKLIYKIKVTDYTDKNVYTEVGQKYNGGDDLHFFINYVDNNDKNTLTFTTDINTKTLVSKTKVSYKSDDASYKSKFDLTFDGKPLEGDITLDKPSNPKTLQQVMEELGLGSGEEFLDPLGIDPENATDPFLF